MFSFLGTDLFDLQEFFVDISSESLINDIERQLSNDDFEPLKKLFIS